VPRLLIGLVLVVLLTSPVRADSSLTAAIAAAYLPRFEDAGLHSIAHERVIEISACDDCFTHDLMRAGTAEVLGFNAGMTDPVTAIIGQWTASPGHHAILSDPGWGRIGCAEVVADGAHYFACVLASGPLPARPSISPANLPPDPPAVLLPDTAMP
jgi:hypothetical protein